ncbi:MAG: hypothetical protein LV471_11970 [Nitrosomonas sp.]|nr:hypothetical protein [Nitrosomonas sp.]
MFTKLFLAALLSVSMSSYAESVERSESSADSIQQSQSSADAKQHSRLKSIISDKQQNSPPLQQDTDPDANQKPSMIDYCRKNTC